jgi:hypothetical protein
LAEIVKARLSLDEDESNRSLLLQAGANILFKYKEVSASYLFLKKYIQNDEVSEDIKTLLQL